MRFILLLLLPITSLAQDFTSSELPIVVVNTLGQEIVDEPDINVEFHIIDNGEGILNNLTDDPVYVGTANIEFRGSSSLGFDKKNYSLETTNDIGEDLDTNLMGFPKEEDWIMHGPWADKSLLRNDLSMMIFREMGHYSSRTRFCELVINEDYRGVYVFMEKIKRDDSRVDIAKLTPQDNSGDELTGGYILKLDWNETEGWESSFSTIGGGALYIQYYDPKPQNITPEQETYIQFYVDSFEKALFSPDLTSYGMHYSEYIDIYTFIDQFLINELSKDVDGYKLSTFIHKDKDSNDRRLKAGPIWDYNIAWFNASYCMGGDETGWLFSETYCEDLDLMPSWWNRFWADDYFRNALHCRWTELHATLLSESYLHAYVDSMTTKLTNAANRNYERWDILEEETWDHPFDPPGSWLEEVDLLKTWITHRLNWMEANMPGDCSLQTSELTAADFEIMPNPSDGRIQIQSASLITHIRLFNLQGQLIYQQACQDNKIDLVADLASGMYLLNVETALGTAQKKVVIR